MSSFVAKVYFCQVRIRQKQCGIWMPSESGHSFNPDQVIEVDMDVSFSLCLFWQ